MIIVVLDSYVKDVSLRKVDEHTKLFHGISINNVAVLRWIGEFSEIVSFHVDSLPKDVFRGFTMLMK